MAKYTYRCDYMDDGSMFADGMTHTFELEFPIGKAPKEVECLDHRQIALRDLFADVKTIRIDEFGNDPFRRYYMSSQGEKAAAAQQRAIGGPRDKSEARAIESATGRKYIGNDVSALTPREQNAIAKRG